jgi:hypothetical protein
MTKQIQTPCNCRPGYCRIGLWACCPARGVESDPLAGLSAEHIEACRRAAMLDLQLALVLKARQLGPSKSNEGER